MTESEVYTEISLSSQVRKTSPYLTRYEKTRIISFRAIKLAEGEHPMFEMNGMQLRVQDIARQELNMGALDDLVIRRCFPDGQYEEWRVGELSLWGE